MATEGALVRRGVLSDSQRVSLSEDSRAILRGVYHQHCAGAVAVERTYVVGHALLQSYISVVFSCPPSLHDAVASFRKAISCMRVLRIRAVRCSLCTVTRVELRRRSDNGLGVAIEV